MKTIKIDFCDFGMGFDKQHNFIMDVLKDKYNVEISNKPDYLFYSCFGFSHMLFDGVKIFYTEEDVFPDFNLCDYAMAFPDIKLGDRYLRYPVFAWTKAFRMAQTKHIFDKEEIKKKDKFCNFVYSNFDANPVRRDFFQELSKYKKVDSGGRYLNNIGTRIKDKLEFQSGYKFSIAFENEKSDDYTTEKITDAFAARTIPIYWGNAKVTKDFNQKAFINCNDYSSFDEVIKRVIEIDNDDKLFEEILREPIFGKKQHAERFSMDVLKKFLYNIFDQPIEKAGRRGKYSWRGSYRELKGILFPDEGIMDKKNQSREKMDGINNNCFEENFNEYVHNNVDINFLYEKCVKNDSHVDISLIKEDSGKYCMKLQYRLNPNSYVLIRRVLVTDKIRDWSAKKGIEIVFTPDDSKRDFIVSIVTGEKYGCPNYISKAYTLKGSEKKTLKVLFEDLEYQPPYSNVATKNVGYDCVNYFELLVSNEKNGSQGSGCLMIESIKLF